MAKNTNEYLDILDKDCSEVTNKLYLFGKSYPDNNANYRTVVQNIRIDTSESEERFLANPTGLACVDYSLFNSVSSTL